MYPDLGFPVQPADFRRLSGSCRPRTRSPASISRSSPAWTLASTSSVRSVSTVSDVHLLRNAGAVVTDDVLPLTRAVAALAGHAIGPCRRPHRLRVCGRSPTRNSPSCSIRETGHGTHVRIRDVPRSRRRTCGRRSSASVPVRGSRTSTTSPAGSTTSTHHTVSPSVDPRLGFAGAHGRVFRPARDVHRRGAADPGRSRRGQARRPALGARRHRAVEHGDSDAGLVPIENMIEGSVSVTLDTLAFDSELLVQREIDLPVSLNLCAKPGVALADIRTVVSFPHAIAQCRGWLAKKLPAADIALVALDRRSRGARSRSRSARDLAAICNALAAELYGLTCWRPRSRTTPRTRPASCSSGAAFRRRPATTRRRSCASSARTGPVRCSASCRSSRRARSTSRKLESRPTKRGLGDYCFFIDFEGHVADELVADALRNLSAKQADVKFLGSYPVGGPAEAGVERRRAHGRGVEARVGVGRTSCGPRSGTARVIDLSACATNRSTGAASSASACATG